MKNEVKVGVLVLIALAAMAYFVIKIEDLGAFRDDSTYPLNVRFRNAAGINIDDPVFLAGVRVGRVAAVRLNMTDGLAEVGVVLRNDVQLHEDATAIVGSSGMLGDRILDLRPGTAGQPIVPPGGWITGGEPVSVDQMVNVVAGIARNLEATTESISRVLGSESGEATLRDILANIEGLTQRLDSVLVENRRSIDSGFSNLDGTLSNLNELSVSLKDSLPAMVSEMRSLSTDVAALLGDNSGAVGDASENLRTMTERLDRSAADLEELIGKMNRGGGTVGRLVNESDTVDRLNEALDSVDDSLAAFDTFFRRVGEARFSFEWRSEFYERLDATKNYFGIRLGLGELDSGRGFELHLVDDNIGGLEEVNITTQTFDPFTGVLLSTELQRQLIRREGFRFNALISQQIGQFRIRGGILENQAGLGIDFAPLRNRFQVTGEIWDLGRDPDPHLKLGMNYRVAGRFFLTGGWDDVFRSDTRSFFFGGGYSFNQ